MRNRKLVYLAVGMFAGIVTPIGIRNFLNADSYKCEKVAIKVESGDDYWGYFEKYCDGNAETYRNDVVEFYGPNLMPGRIVYLPSSDKCDLQWVKMANGSEYVYESCPE